MFYQVFRSTHSPHPIGTVHTLLCLYCHSFAAGPKAPKLGSRSSGDRWVWCPGESSFPRCHCGKEVTWQNDVDTSHGLGCCVCSSRPGFGRALQQILSDLCCNAVLSLPPSPWCWMGVPLLLVKSKHTVLMRSSSCRSPFSWEKVLFLGWNMSWESDVIPQLGERWRLATK